MKKIERIDLSNGRKNLSPYVIVSALAALLCEPALEGKPDFELIAVILVMLMLMRWAKRFFVDILNRASESSDGIKRFDDLYFETCLKNKDREAFLMALCVFGIVGLFMLLQQQKMSEGFMRFTDQVSLSFVFLSLLWFIVDLGNAKNFYR